MTKNDMNWLADLLPVLHHAGHEETSYPWYDPPRVIFDHELFLIGNGGSAVVEIDGHARTIEGPGYLVVPPGVWHVCKGRWSMHVWRAWVHFDWQSGSPDPKRLFSYDFTRADRKLVRPAPDAIPRKILSGNIDDLGVTQALHARLERAYRSGSRRAIELARSVLRELLIGLLWEPEPVETCERQPQGRVFALRQRLSETALQPKAPDFSLRTVLSGLGRSYEHLEREFRGAFGVTPSQFINSVRIERAKELLRTTNRPIREVSAQAGFVTATHFHRVFREATGMTARRYRISVV